MSGSSTGNWQTMRVGDYLLAYPLPEAGRPFEVILCDPLTGNLVQRLNLSAGMPKRSVGGEKAPAPVPARPAVAVTPRGIVVLLGATAWGLAARE